jgi:hypothetical protein
MRKGDEAFTARVSLVPASIVAGFSCRYILHEGKIVMTLTCSPSLRSLVFLWIGVCVAASPMLLVADSGAIRGSGIDWLKPTGGPYPLLDRGERVWIRVSLNRQRVEIMDGERKIYTMIASTGLDSPADNRTPEGTFYIQSERGLSFYSAKVGEGARYWVSWLHHGEYLFHSVPTDRQGRIIAAEARMLGEKASHGCIRLSLPDAKWIYENILYDAKVVIGP